MAHQDEIAGYLEGRIPNKKQPRSVAIQTWAEIQPCGSWKLQLKLHVRDIAPIKVAEAYHEAGDGQYCSVQLAKQSCMRFVLCGHHGAAQSTQECLQHAWLIHVEGRCVWRTLHAIVCSTTILLPLNCQQLTCKNRATASSSKSMQHHNLSYALKAAQMSG